ncbi:MAG: acylphosphatase [Candidatus Brockarchaeota archaeon]|nr:acylphosphatase [Candidatus Brockarchaeota archaeon]
MAKKRVVIKGEKVQDVGYRLFLLEAAESIGLRGFQARNVEDYVEFLVEGDDNKVAEFISFAKTNYPELARVEKVTVEDYEGNVMSIEGFYRSFSAGQLVKIVNVGVSMLQKQDILISDVKEMKSDIKEMKDDIKEMKSDIKEMKSDIKEMKKGQEILISEVRNLREDLKAYMDERFRRLETEIARIKEKIRIT